MFDDDLFLELLIKAKFIFYKSVKLGRTGRLPMNGTTFRKIMFLMLEQKITNTYVCLKRKTFRINRLL